MTDSISLDRQIQCVRREIGMRENVYPHWVAKRKMTQGKADDELAAMKAVLETLMCLCDTLRMNDEVGR